MRVDKSKFKSMSHSGPTLSNRVVVGQLYCCVFSNSLLASIDSHTKHSINRYNCRSATKNEPRGQATRTTYLYSSKQASSENQRRPSLLTTAHPHERECPRRVTSGSRRPINRLRRRILQRTRPVCTKFLIDITGSSLRCYRNRHTNTHQRERARSRRLHRSIARRSFCARVGRWMEGVVAVVFGRKSNDVMARSSTRKRRHE
jgi:hypothetical protein